MTTYEVLSLLFLGGTFLVALLAYIDRIQADFLVTTFIPHN
jgi:hypothetical protein